MKSDFSDVQILVSVSALDGPALDRTWIAVFVAADIYCRSVRRR